MRDKVLFALRLWMVERKENYARLAETTAKDEHRQDVYYTGCFGGMAECIQRLDKLVKEAE